MTTRKFLSAVLSMALGITSVFSIPLNVNAISTDVSAVTVNSENKALSTTTTDISENAVTTANVTAMETTTAPVAEYDNSNADFSFESDYFFIEKGQSAILHVKNSKRQNLIYFVDDEEIGSAHIFYSTYVYVYGLSYGETTVKAVADDGSYATAKIIVFDPDDTDAVYDVPVVTTTAYIRSTPYPSAYIETTQTIAQGESVSLDYSTEMFTSSVDFRSLSDYLTITNDNTNQSYTINCSEDAPVGNLEYMALVRSMTGEYFPHTYSIEITESTQLNINGDANCDNNVNMADAVLIMQSLANPDKYGVNGTDDTHITAQGEKNGDMDGNGLTNADALEIQKILLKLNDTPEQISPIQPPTVQSIHFENISSLAKEINDYDLDKYSEISREGYRKMYDTIKNDGSIYEVKVNETVNIDSERGIAVVPNAKYEDLGIYSYTKNDFQIIVYYIDKGTEHNGIADYFTKRFSQNILKEISVNGKETVISEFGITDDTRRICASAFIDDSHYYTVRSCVGGTEEELTAFLNNMTFVNVPIA